MATTTVGEVELKLSFDNKSVKTSMNEVENTAEKTGSKISNHFEKTGDKIGKALKKGLDIGIDALKYASTAVTAFTGVAIKAFGDYEQAVGGAQKIFDQLDYSAIQADAMDAYKNMQMSAEQYLSTINSVGATFASSMGQEKGYETAKLGMQALSDYATGTGASVDLLTDKFKAISRSTTSYLSIADQFSGILPQTTDDFLKQAQSAGFLSNEYQKLNDVPVAEYQQALAKMLDQGVAKLNLTENTANEAMGTISGSLGMLKTAWQNTMSTIGEGGDNFNTAMEQLTTSMSAVVKNVMRIVPTIVSGIGQMANGILPIIISTIQEIAPTVLSCVLELAGTFIEALPTILDILSQIALQVVAELPKLIQKVVDALPALLQKLTEILPSLVKAVTKLIIETAKILTNPANLKMILNGALQLFGALIEALPEILVSLIEALPQIMLGIVEFLTDPANIGMIISAVMQGVWAIIQQLPTIIGTLIQAFVSYYGQIFAMIDNLFGGIFTKIGEFFVGVATTIGGWLSSFYETFLAPIVDFVKNCFVLVVAVVATAIDAISGVIGAIVGWIDANVIQPVAVFFSGLWDGIVNGVTSAFNGITSFLGGIASWINNNFISPVAGFFSGLWNGIKSGVEGIKSVFETVFNTIANIIKTPINAIINAINGVIDSINGLTVPDWVPAIGGSHTNFPHIPTLAQGGFANGATTAMIGEAGREAVLPLERNTDNWSGLLAQTLLDEIDERQGESTMGGITVTMNNYINNEMDADEIGRRMIESIRRVA